MRNKRKSISLLGWIIGALLLIYLGVFCYLNLCKYAQHVDSDIAAEALLAREIWVEKDITPNDWISSTERRIIGMPTVAAVFYGITGSMQTAAGITCVLLGAILLGTFYFSEKIIFEQAGINYGIAGIVCAANQRFSQ